MHSTSALYKTILAKPHRSECKAIINGVEYTDADLVSVFVQAQLFGREAPSVGNTVARMVKIEMLAPEQTIPTQSRIELYARIRSGNDVSEWIPKGVYFVDTRSTSKTRDNGSLTLVLEGYDAMLKGEQIYASTGTFPKTDAALLTELCGLIGVTSNYTPSRGYSIDKPNEYSVRELLGFIAAANGGNFVISDDGKLEFIPLNAGTATATEIEAATLDAGDMLNPITKVTLHKMDGNKFTAGTATGRNLNVDCPFATQSMATNILSVVNGYAYQPFSALQSLIDPSLEMGDKVTVNGVTSRIYQQDIDIGYGFSATLGAMEEKEIDHNYQFKSSGGRAVDRVKSDVNAIASPEEIRKFREERKTLFAEIVDDNGVVHSARLNLAAITDGEHTKTLAELLADVITLNGEVNVNGNLYINNGVVYCKEIMASQKGLQAPSVLTQKVLIELSTGTLQFVPMNITDKDGNNHLVLGAY